MEKLAAKSYDDIFEPLGFNPSPSDAGRNDRTASEMPLRSSLSTESFMFCRTNSGSESSEQGIYSSEPSPLRWPSMKSGRHNQSMFVRLGLKELQQDGDEKMTTLHAEDLGSNSVICFTSHPPPIV